VRQFLVKQRRQIPRYIQRHNVVKDGNDQLKANSVQTMKAKGVMRFKTV
jgi:hypothetical protein